MGAAHCKSVFSEKISTRVKVRPELEKALELAYDTAGPAEEGAAALSAHMRAAWTVFATRGDPGWPAYEPERRRTRIFAARPTVDRHPEEASRRIWAGQPLSALTLVEG
ncbi:hypothetical protein [Embleya sp. NPDC059237]|uniref:hypothetical protein n=1 Tax=Embleya sp. NPDC059237 TaxID=3346784 RepID=UPI00368DBB67